MEKFVKNFIKENIEKQDRQLLVVMKFGSHLYGTNTSKSDLDYKGVFIPSKKEVFLNEIEHTINYSSGNNESKNSSDDLDIELYSIHK